MNSNKSNTTILVISMGFLFLHLMFGWKWAAIVSLIIGAIGIISSYLSDKIHWAWMQLSHLLGLFIPNVILTIVFFFFLTPISICFRLFNQDILMLSNKYDSYFIVIDKEIEEKSFEKIW